MLKELMIYLKVSVVLGFLTLIGQLWSQPANAETHQFVGFHALGSSPRGRFVAIEEFGLDPKTKRPFSRIKVKNAWKRRKDKVISFYVAKSKDQDIDDVREENLRRARQILKKKFKISQLSSASSST